ncbi:hypothetical protein ACN38_g11261 [Penicillium nordicum]|uniref:Uncharacterized protein n=1 Tax=Penicillium nordicum TaxID=229535 RepID=A0A0M8NV46_9EURO|nr:hypothetical protein ACN38_g11261 [Penicillium nordicum]
MIARSELLPVASNGFAFRIPVASKRIVINDADDLVDRRKMIIVDGAEKVKNRRKGLKYAIVRVIGALPLSSGNRRYGVPGRRGAGGSRAHKGPATPASKIDRKGRSERGNAHNLTAS